MEEQESPFDTLRVLGPVVLKSSLVAGAVSGSTGAAIGGVAGLLRTSTPMLFAAASGLQCATLGSAFWASRQAVLIYYARQFDTTIRQIPTRQRRQASAIGGGVAGFTTAAIFRGRSNLIPGVLVFSALGFFGQATYESINARHTAVQQSNPNAWERLLDSRFSPVKKLSDANYDSLMREKLLRIEAEISIIDDDIANLRASYQTPSTPPRE